MSAKTLIIAFVIVLVIYEIFLVISGVIKEKRKKKNESKEGEENDLSTNKENE